MTDEATGHLKNKIMKLKVILAALAIFFVTGLFVKIKVLTIQNDKLQIDKSRLENNWYNSIQDANENREYFLKQKELSWQLKQERDELAEKLKIRPKEIEKIVKVETLIRDTVIKEIPVYPLINGWGFTDTINKCTIYKGEVNFTDSVPSIKRTGFIEQNEITSTYYRKRPHKFLFIRYGKYVNSVLWESECGNPKVETFNFVK